MKNLLQFAAPSIEYKLSLLRRCLRDHQQVATGLRLEMNEPLSQALSLKDLLDIIEKIEGRINNYWNFYTIALFAIASWIFGSSMTFNSWQAAIIAMALALFFASNLMFITINESRLAAMESEIRNVAAISKIESERFRKFLTSNPMPHRQKTSAILHLFVDVAVILFVLNKGFY